MCGNVHTHVVVLCSNQHYSVVYLDHITVCGNVRTHVVVLCSNQHSVYTQTLAFSYSLFYLQNRINNYKQTTKSTVCVNYDYATIRITAVVQFCGNKSAKFPGKLRHITEQIYDFYSAITCLVLLVTLSYTNSVQSK